MLEWAVISFCYDLTDPKGSRVQVAVAEVRDDNNLEAFRWIRDLGMLGLDETALQAFPVYPEVFKQHIEKHGLQAMAARGGQTSLYISDILPVTHDGPVAIFGDVHGKNQTLVKLVDEIQNRYGDIPMYTAGDLIDRGPHSRSCIDTCIKHGIRGVMGNHDQWLHQYISGFGFDDFALHPVMGGKETMRSYGLENPTRWTAENELHHHMPNNHTTWVYNLLPYMKLIIGGHTYWLIHSGLVPSDVRAAWNVARGDEDEFMALVSRKQRVLLQWSQIGKLPQGAFHFPSGATMVMGHRVLWKGPVIEDHVICLDTGCGLPKGRLSAVILPQGEVVSVR